MFVNVINPFTNEEVQVELYLEVIGIIDDKGKKIVQVQSAGVTEV